MSNRIDPREYTPTESRVLIRLNTSPETTSSGIEIVRLPDRDGDRRPRAKFGWVERLGPDVQDAQVGDYVMTDKYSGAEFRVGDSTYMIVHEEKILCILEGPTACE